MYSPIGTERDIGSEHWERLDSLNKKIHKALSLDCQGYLDFFNERKDPRNKVKEFSAFNGGVQYYLEYYFHRLQQLNLRVSSPA